VFAADATAQAIAAIREHLGGPLDGIIWSLAAPRAQDPRTGAVVASALKPYGEPAWVWTFTNRDAEGVSKIVSIPMAPGTPEEAVATQYVMGGRIVERWVDALQGAGILAPGCRLLTLTYRGSPLNAGIYRDGLIGLAKADLEFHTRAMGAVLKDRVGGSAHAVCGPAVVTEASGGIPGVPLYMATLLDVMGREHEDPVASMRRMFDEKISLDGSFAPVVDDEGLVRMDDRELSPVYLKRMTDRFHARHAGDVFEPELFDLFMRAYAQTRGFDVDGVDYEAEFDTDALT
ncbi:MAG: hypothetical protein KC636_29660, partial [Myxococcales bacterium]|nr:hypothetical protein [Myxococcales bacterium]